MTENYFISNDIGILNNQIHDQAEKIKRLEAQVNAAHKILGSESFGWLVIGSNHEVSHWEMLSPYIDAYWDKYGTYFRPKPNDKGDYMGDWYSGHASFVIEGWFAETDEEAQEAITKFRDELVDWVNTKKKSELVVSHIEVDLDPQEIETP